MSELPKKKSSTSLAGSKTSLKKSLSSVIASKTNVHETKRASMANTADITPPQIQPSPSTTDVKDPSPSQSTFSYAYYHERQLEGIIPLFLTAQSQQIVKCVIDVDVTPEKMFRMIPKSDLMQDMATRLAISDFTPAKPEILAYPREELMLHYDPEYKYTQNFFLVVSPETVDSILNPPKPAEEELQADVQKSNRPKEWISLGSEKEIEQEWIKEGRFLTVEVSRKFSEFKQPCNFGDRDAAESYLELKPFKDPNYELMRLETNVAVQAVPEYSSTAMQTIWNRPINFAIQYEPLDMDPLQKEEMFQSEQLEIFVLGISAKLEQYLQQNEIMDIFRNDYTSLGEEEITLEQGAQTVLQEYQSFTDLINSKDRCISCIDWHPIQRGVLAVSCTQSIGLDEKIQKGFTSSSKQSVIILWSFQDPIHPQLILEAPEDVTCFQINPLDSSMIVAGCYNGQVVLWDISEYQERLQSSRKSDSENSHGNEREQKTQVPSVKYQVVSAIEASHRGPITDIKWLPKHYELGNNGEPLESSESGDKQIVASSLDGTVSVWDLRYKKDIKSLDLTWRPNLRVPLSAMDNSFDYSIAKVMLQTSLVEDFKKSENKISEEGKPPAKVVKPYTSKFYCATEEGDLIYADWFSEKVSEEKASRVEYAINAHYGPMCDIDRSPFFPDLFLSIGGWSFHVWKEKCHIGPIVSRAQAPCYLTCCKWSPTRPGVFFVGRSDGMLEVWDLLDKSHEPTTVQSVATSAIASISIRQYTGKGAQQYIAVGDDSGTLHILECPKNLQKITKNEKGAIGVLFDRETKRALSANENKKLRLRDRGAFEAAQLQAISVSKPDVGCFKSCRDKG
jgi:WD40 repeat protein